MTTRTVQDSVSGAGDYELLHVIGGGGMGTVYKGRHRPTGQEVAVKVMPSHLAKNPVLLQRFEREFRVASRLHHPNVVRALEFRGDAPSPYLVMELVEGESVGRRLEWEGRLPEAEAVAIIVQVAEGLHCAHGQGLLHRDVKPDNIVVTAGGLAKLTDLGLAKDCGGGSELTHAGKGLGTPDFMPPEQFRDAAGVTPRSDVYALAATLYEMVTGRLPFGSRNAVQTLTRKLNNDFPAPRQLVPELSSRTDWAIRRAMRAAPEERPASCAEFVADLLGTGPLPDEANLLAPEGEGPADCASDRTPMPSRIGLTLPPVAAPEGGEAQWWSLVVAALLAAGAAGWWLLS